MGGGDLERCRGRRCPWPCPVPWCSRPRIGDGGETGEVEPELACRGSGSIVNYSFVWPLIGYFVSVVLSRVSPDGWKITRQDDSKKCFQDESIRRLLDVRQHGKRHFP